MRLLGIACSSILTYLYVNRSESTAIDREILFFLERSSRACGPIPKSIPCRKLKMIIIIILICFNLRGDVRRDAVRATLRRLDGALLRQGGI